MEEVEKRYVLQVLQAVNGNSRKPRPRSGSIAARCIGSSRATAWTERWGDCAGTFRPSRGLSPPSGSRSCRSSGRMPAFARGTVRAMSAGMDWNGIEGQWRQLAGRMKSTWTWVAAKFWSSGAGTEASKFGDEKAEKKS